MQKKTALSLGLVVMACSAFGNAAFLKEMAEEQKAVSALTEQAFQDGGADGMKWRFFDINDRSCLIDCSQFDNPQILVLPVHRGKKTNGKYHAVRDGKLGNDYRMSSGEYSVIKLSKNMLDADAIQINSWAGGFQVWVAEKETISKIIKKYIMPGIQIYSAKWVPLLEKHGITADEFYFELKAMGGKPFPTTPQAMAKAYANACSAGAKDKAAAAAKKARSWADAENVRQFYLTDCRMEELRARIERVHPDHIMLALNDMNRKFPERKVLDKLGRLVPKLAERKEAVLAKIASGSPDAGQAADALMEGYRRLLLANPLLDNMEVLAVQREVGHLNLRDEFASMPFPGRIGRGGSGAVLGAPSLSTHSIVKNIQSPNRIGWNSSIVKLSNLRGDVQTTPLYAPDDDQMLISNARLHWDGERVAFSMGSYEEPMALFELDMKSGETTRLTPESKDHFFDPCYLPDGNIIVMSTAIMTGLPCEGGSHMLANMYMLNPESGKIRQLGVDQENSYHATVQEDGRVLYIRYEYTDAAHYFMRIMMNMNPDGTNQREIYGSNSVWPTALFYPQQVPGKPNLYTATVAGHHGPTHMGSLVLFDVSKGRREADGAVQFIGDKEKPVEAVMVDRLYANDYPKFMYSVPLDAEYHIAMMKPDRYAPWGLYLVDVFDNKTLIHQPRDGFLAWPQVLKKKPLPPVIPSRVREDSKTSTLYVQDIYEGPGLQGIPRGTVKELAIYAFHYGYKSAASHRYVGHESGWDARYMLGTVPVNEDGSAMFTVPSMMPITFLALDKDGMAVQKMRTWMNPQPGENLSCIGCHETADQAPVNRPTQAFTQRPHEIKPWHGPARPYSFVMEVQPLLDQYCIACHGEGKKIDLTNSFSEEEMLDSKRYSRSYEILQKYVRRNGPESNPELMVPMEWHASSSKLIQMLEKGHHGVQLDDEAMRRLTMWIDLNVPFHAAFHPGQYDEYGDQVKWRRDSLKKYAGLDWDPENEYKDLVREFVKQPAIKPIKPKKQKKLKMPKLKGWPFDAKGGQKTMAVEFGTPGRETKSYDSNRAITKMLDGKERIEFVRIPAGTYVMGAANGYPNETPRVVEIKKPFWMSVAEISNSQLQAFDPQHDSKFADLPEKDQSSRGVPLYTEAQPAVRVSHGKAAAFCDWLSKETGKKVSLPTEEQWEWAARAGTASDLWYGGRDDDFAAFANLSDKARFSGELMRRNAPLYFTYVENVNDKFDATAPVKSYKPNAWGLHDMAGNAEEWTASKGGEGKYIVKGGSWSDMPKDATSATRWGYNENIRLPDLGFRIIIEE
ncbi:SUMF1/EgtB/PvdO family nonheme iron enzyme [Pontiella sulfatireligans]|uniref:Uncharacterized protein n=1 Tax=Pontiella sulfatireligans TaxID=2750658 RepID=A0A6C2UX02_9BACT|nr:SUMF1/EgtB/PvdO family nonheme iron enzyme [Pontiella sulfatireligans]VGO23376.1 hypothetical protein SCARR_05483 [Pontiella sulfatireligans]